jgi:hypothetical protein
MNKLISSLVKTAVVYAATLAVTNLNAQTSSSSPKVESVEIFTIKSNKTKVIGTPFLLQGMFQRLVNGFFRISWSVVQKTRS